MRCEVVACLGGVSLKYFFVFPETAKYFAPYFIEESKGKVVALADYDLKEWKLMGNEFSPYGEFSMLHIQTSSVLLPYGRCIFHGVAFCWHDKAWLMTAPSGVGKSTQYQNLKELYPEEISIINGDRPVLELKKDNTIMVHPSPWNGKENWHGAEAAPLAGVICLMQDRKNQIKRLSTEEAAKQIFMSVFQSYESEKIIKMAGGMAAEIMKRVPVWLLTNLGDFDSSRLLYETIKEWEEHGSDV